MKRKVTKNIIIATLILFFPGQFILSQSNPVITKKYSNTEIERLIDENRDSDSHDIAPHESLRLKFAKDFPKARDIDWELGANIYEVEFEIGRIDYKAYYDADANLLMYKHDITSTALPQVIKNTVSSKYPQYRYDDVEKILRGSEVFYKIELERGESDVKLVVDKKGNILNKYFD